MAVRGETNRAALQELTSSVGDTETLRRNTIEFHCLRDG